MVRLNTSRIKTLCLSVFLAFMIRTIVAWGNQIERKVRSLMHYANIFKKISYLKVMLPVYVYGRMRYLGFLDSLLLLDTVVNTKLGSFVAIVHIEGNDCRRLENFDSVISDCQKLGVDQALNGLLELIRVKLRGFHEFSTSQGIGLLKNKEHCHLEGSHGDEVTLFQVVQFQLSATQVM